MTEKTQSVTHATFVIERNFLATPEKVFAAFSDPAKKKRWFADDEALKYEEFTIDFRVGGFERKRFQTKIGVCTNDTVYLDIVPNRRIVFAYTMAAHGMRFSSSQATVELLPTQKGTDLVFTEQGAFFEHSDGPKMRQEGWTYLFTQLAKELERDFA